MNNNTEEVSNALPVCVKCRESKRSLMYLSSEGNKLVCTDCLAVMNMEAAAKAAEDLAKDIRALRTSTEIIINKDGTDMPENN